MTENDKKTKRYTERAPSARSLPPPRKKSDSEIKILQDIASDLLALRADFQTLRTEIKQNNIIIKARLDNLDAEVGKVGAQGRATNLLAGDTNAKVIDLHKKLLASADGLGGRLLKLEQRQGKPGGSSPTATRTPRRG